MKRAIIDNDFFDYLTNRGNLHEEKYFLDVMQELEYEPVVHEFVYEHEMMGNSIAAKLVSSGQMTVIRYNDFLKKPAEISFYNRMFGDLYQYCNVRTFKNPFKDARTYREDKANLGEIHSTLLALILGYDLFLSNDNGSKTLAKNKIDTELFQFKVWNLTDVFEYIALKEETRVSKKDFVNLTKGDHGRKDKIQYIKGIWREN